MAGPPGDLRQSEMSVDRSKRSNSSLRNGQTGDVIASQRTGQNQLDQSHHVFCQGDGREFESRLPLSRSRSQAGPMCARSLVLFIVSADHRPSVAHHGTGLERWMRPRVQSDPDARYRRPIPIMAARLCHTWTSTTLNVSAHSVPGGDLLAAEALWRGIDEAWSLDVRKK
jgi:hypothetical protein